MNKAWENSSVYNIFRVYIQWAVRNSFSRITVVGRENIPDTGKVSVLFAMNHCNTMMDSLVLLQSRREPTAFVARADVFDKPLFSKLLHGMKILPIYRSRDGEHSQEKNVAVFDAVVDILYHGMPLSIHPEGTHRARRSLLPMKKGIFRIAEQARHCHPEKPVVIVPVGLDYEDFFNCMTEVKISFGKPIPVNGDEDLDMMAALLYERISALFTFFPDDENLDAAETAFRLSHKRHYSFVHYLFALALLPLFLLAGVLCSPMLIAAAYIKPRIKDKAWLNTVRYSCKLALTPFTVLAAAIAGFITLCWPLALLLTLLTAYSHPIFYRILVYYKSLLKD